MIEATKSLIEQAAEIPANLSLGTRVRQARIRLGLTQDKLAHPQFTKSYISAIEHDRVRPSLKALNYLSQRLDVSPHELLSDHTDRPGVSDQDVLNNDLTLRLDHALQAILTKHAREGLRLLDAAERLGDNAPDLVDLPIRFRMRFLRGQAYLQMAEPLAAQRELQQALTLGEQLINAAEELAAARNLLGVAYYQQDQPQLALEQHEPCRQAVAAGGVKSLHLQLLIYRNLAQDHSALGNFAAAMEIYSEAAAACENATNLERQAALSWDAAQEATLAGEHDRARDASSKAVQIFEAAENIKLAMGLTIDSTAVMVEHAQYERAEAELLRVRAAILSGTDINLIGAIYQLLADIKLQQGQLEQAASYSRQTLELLNSPQIEKGSVKDLTAHAVARSYIVALVTAGRIAEQQKDASMADAQFHEALAAAREIEDHALASNIARSYADLLAARNMHQEAVAYYHEALDLLRFEQR